MTGSNKTVKLGRRREITTLHKNEGGRGTAIMTSSGEEQEQEEEEQATQRQEAALIPEQTVPMFKPSS